MLVQAPDSVARKEIWRECQLVHPGKHDVLGGLGDQYSEHRQDAGHPQLDCSYRRLQATMSDFTPNVTVNSHLKRRQGVKKKKQQQKKTVESKSANYEMPHHGDRDGEHTLEQHVNRSEGGGCNCLKQSV